MSKVPSRHRTAGPQGRTVLPLLLIAAAAADSLTFVLMGTAHELNPIAAHAPWAALVLKGALALVLVAWPWPHRTALLLFAIAAWTFGSLTNLAVLLEVT